MTFLSREVEGFGPLKPQQQTAKYCAKSKSATA